MIHQRPKMTYRIEGTLAETVDILAGHGREDAVGGSEHERYFPDEHALQYFLLSFLLQVHIVDVGDIDVHGV